MTYPGLDPESPKDVYEGDMVEGKREGSGTYTFANGGKYDGGMATDYQLLEGGEDRREESC